MLTALFWITTFARYFAKLRERYGKQARLALPASYPKGCVDLVVAAR